MFWDLKNQKDFKYPFSYKDMKKVGVLLLAFLFISILALTIVSAQNTTEEKAYNCLKGKVQNKCSSLTAEEQSFSLLALSDNSAVQSECKTALKNKGSNNECWPSTSCKIKDTALAIIALDNIVDDTSKAETWLLSKTKTPSELEWYLEIESSQATQCEIKYDSTSKTINIAENKKISGTPGTCLSLAYENYWLKISNDCLSKEFEVSCNKDFISTLLYKKTGSNIWHVSSKVESASASGKTKNKVDSLCFGLAGCDYEGSLWATLALQKTGNNITSFTPYLIALAEDNDKYFPSSLLYYLTNSDEYLQEILSSQKTQGYWDFAEKGKFYDTALALLALTESQAENNAKSWLEEEQGNDGCWVSVRDTAFLIWAGWPRIPINGGTETPDCEPTYYCMTPGECDDVTGEELENYACSGLNICCNKPAREETCEEKAGIICPSGEACSQATVSAFDTPNCCLGTCEEETPECEQSGYNCRASCLTSEEEVTYDCTAADVCCQTKPSGGGGIPWFVWVLAVLIILVVLGIIFRNRLKVFLFKFKGGFKKGPVTSTRPPFMPPSAMPTGLRRMMPPMMPRPIPKPVSKPLTKPGTKTDKELEETLKKLREMSK